MQYDFGKINYCGTGRRYPVRVDVRLYHRGGEETTVNGVPTGRKTPEFYEFAASGQIGSRSFGQNLDEIAEFVHDPLFLEIYDLWKKYHLNGAHAGTPEQEAAVDEYLQNNKSYDYTKVCAFLKERGLYEVDFHGMTVGKMWDGIYRYGQAWIVQEIPEKDLARIREIVGEK